jgi:hypothetical protein
LGARIRIVGEFLGHRATIRAVGVHDHRSHGANVRMPPAGKVGAQFGVADALRPGGRVCRTKIRW